MKHAGAVDLATHQKPYVLVKQLARCKECECDPRTILRMIQSGSLRAYRVGREWRVPIEEARRAFHVKPPQDTTNN